MGRTTSIERSKVRQIAKQQRKRQKCKRFGKSESNQFPQISINFITTGGFLLDGNITS